jgi:hypothetical protein
MPANPDEAAPDLDSIPDILKVPDRNALLLQACGKEVHLHTTSFRLHSQ